MAIQPKSKLKTDTTPLGQARLKYFWIKEGPWSALDEFKPFPSWRSGTKTKGANFYPEDMTTQQFETWVASLPKEEQEQAKSFFTVIRWKDAGSNTHSQITAIPFSEEYKEDLNRSGKPAERGSRPH